jgi:hypothetical protein
LGRTQARTSDRFPLGKKLDFKVNWEDGTGADGGIRMIQAIGSCGCAHLSSSVLQQSKESQDAVLIPFVGPRAAAKSQSIHCTPTVTLFTNVNIEVCSNPVPPFGTAPALSLKPKRILALLAQLTSMADALRTPAGERAATLSVADSEPPAARSMLMSIDSEAAVIVTLPLEQLEHDLLGMPLTAASTDSRGSSMSQKLLTLLAPIVGYLPQANSSGRVAESNGIKSRRDKVTAGMLVAATFLAPMIVAVGLGIATR